MRIWLLGSGSKGNAVLVEAGGSRVLVDVGFGPRVLAERLAIAGIPPESIEGVLVTHEHIDHVSGVRRAAKKWGWRVLATEGTITGFPALRSVHAEVIPRCGTLRIGELDVQTTPTSHDAAESVCVVLTSVASGARVGIATDLGSVTGPVRRAMKDVDLLVLESNHDMEMLRTGPYPVFLQKRIAGSLGHLSNTEAGSFARDCVTPELKQIVLAHLSETNNTPRAAMDAVGSMLKRTSFRGRLHAAHQHRVLGPIEPVRPRPEQLGLGL